MEAIPTSKLPQLLDLCVNHHDGFTLSEKDRKYLEGWQHCLLAIAGKLKFSTLSQQNITGHRFSIKTKLPNLGGMKSLKLDGSSPKAIQNPSTEVGNPFMN